MFRRMAGRSRWASRAVHLSRKQTPPDADVHAFLIADIRGWTSFTQEHGDEDAAPRGPFRRSGTRGGRGSPRASGRTPRRRGHGRLRLAALGDPSSRGPTATVRQGDHRRSIPAAHRRDRARCRGSGCRRGRVPGRSPERRRTASSAREAGEILASREIVHLARRIDGVRFAERGPLELKGLDQPVHVVAMRSEDRDAALAMAPFVRPSAPPRRPQAVEGGRGGGGVRGRRGVDCHPIGPGCEVARRSPRTRSASWTRIRRGRLDARAPVPSRVDRGIGGRCVGDQSRCRDRDADRPGRAGDRRPIQVGENPTGIAVGGGAVWVVDSGGPSVSRISPDTEVVETDRRRERPGGYRGRRGGVWVTNRFDGTVSRIDPTAARSSTIPVGLDPRGIAVGFGSVWVALAGRTRWCGSTRKRTRCHADRCRQCAGVAGRSADDVWVVNTLDDTVSRISPDTNSVVDTVPVGDGPRDRGRRRDRVGGERSGRDALADRARADVCVQQPDRERAARDRRRGGDLWVSVRGTATSHRGGTLRLLGSRPIARPGGRLGLVLVACCTCSGTVSRVRADRWRQPARPRPGDFDTDADRRRSNVHLRAAPGDPILERRGRRGRRFPPRARTGVPSRA